MKEKFSPPIFSLTKQKKRGSDRMKKENKSDKHDAKTMLVPWDVQN